jgi:hypothetical protein
VPLQPVRLASCPPALLFLPPGEHAALPLVLFGHGADLSKDDPIMQTLVKTFCRHGPPRSRSWTRPGTANGPTSR